MFYQGEPEALVDVGDVVDVPADEVETINQEHMALQRNQAIQTNDPDVIVIQDTQPTSTNAIENTSSTPSSRKRTR